MIHFKLTILFLFLSVAALAQKDTINIPIGKYGYIKLGDKVYKIISSLEESKPEIPSLHGVWELGSGTITPAYYGTDNGLYQEYKIPQVNVEIDTTSVTNKRLIKLKK